MRREEGREGFAGRRRWAARPIALGAKASDAAAMRDMDFTADAMGELARWAWAFDMDDDERSAAWAAQGPLRGQRLAWQAVALWGPGPRARALRKLRRAAMARLDARDLEADLGWDALGHGPEESKAMRAAMASLAALAEPRRVEGLWERARADGAREASPLAAQAMFARAVAQPWGGRSWQRAAWSAMAGMDWPEGEDEAMAARALSLVELGAIEAAVGDAGGGAGSGARRL